MVTKGTAQLSVGTDSQGNEGLVHKWLTSKMPLGLVTMEFAAQLAARHCTLNLVWRRREEKTEADALTNEKVAGVDPARRVDASNVSLIRLPTFAVKLAEFQVTTAEARARNRCLNIRRAQGTDEPSLRSRDPWSMNLVDCRLGGPGVSSHV